MSAFQIAIAVFAAVALFLYGLTSFSREVQAAGGQVLRDWLGRATGRWWAAFLLGAGATLAVQSSSATTSLTVALVDAGVIRFVNSLPVMLGANVGTTATAWLVSFKLTGLGAFFIVVGTLLGMLPVRWHVFGKPVFYFGFIFFSLDLISLAVAPLRDAGWLRQALLLADNPWLGLLAGAAVTALIQSSSATSGLAVLFVQQGVLDAPDAIPVVIGANIGTTTTALLASISLSGAARRAAVVNTLFNCGGALLLAPWLTDFAAGITAAAPSPAAAVALAHTVFNTAMAALFLLLCAVFRRRLEAWSAPVRG
jgi:Na/Pi-cotransporter